jgi:hypothetical protein
MTGGLAGLPDAKAFLTLALSSKRVDVLRELEANHWVRPAYLDVAVDGVPGVTRISVFAWPEPPGRPGRVGIDIVRAGDYVLPRPITAGFDLAAHELPAPIDEPVSEVVTAQEIEQSLEDTRPATIHYKDAVWHLSPGGVRQEIQDLDAEGRPLYADVDTDTYCYKLVCPRCGRHRYAKRNSTYQIKYCRVCTQAERRRKRALDQYARRDRSGPAKRLSAHKTDQALNLYETGRYNISEVARAVGMSPSGMRKLLQRHGMLEEDTP